MSEIRIFDPDAPNTLHGELLAAAYAEFDCGPVACTSSQRSRMSRGQAKRRDKVTQTTVEFTDLMLSPQAPQTEDEAVKLLSPVTAWLLSWLVRQLAIQVIKFLWRKWHAEKFQISNFKSEIPGGA